MNIVVATPTGHVGSHVARSLIRAGVRPTLLARKPEALDPELQERSTVFEVDLADREAVLAATEKAQALFWVDPPSAQDDPLQGYARMADNVSAAVITHGIPKVVFQSSVGAEARHGFGEIDGLAHTEVLLDQTGASVAHLRCGYFFSNLLFDLESLRQGKLITPWPLDYSMAWVAPRDIAGVAVGRLLSPYWQGRVVQAVHGPEDLSFTEVAALLSEVLGRPIHAERISEAALADTLRAIGRSDRQIEATVGMSRGFLMGFEPELQRNLLSTTHTTLAAWAYQELRPLF